MDSDKIDGLDAGLHGAAWGARLQAGIVAGLMATISSISHASLVTGTVAPHATSAVIGMALVSTAVLCLVLGALSGVRGVVPMAQDIPSVAIGAILATTLATRVASGGTLTTPEIVVLCLLSGIAFGAALLLFGTLRLADIMRYAPRPVVAGFLAGTGYLIARGAIGICLGAGLDWSSAPSLLQAPALGKTLVALTVLAALIVATRRLPVNIAVGATMLLAIVLFQLLAPMLGADPDRLQADGWFVTLPEGGLSFPPVSLHEIDHSSLGLIAEQALPLLSMIVLASLAVLMNVSALEARTRTDLRLNRELRVLGLSNLAAAGLGGLPGYHGVSSTMAALRITAPHRAISLIAGTVPIFVFLQGDAVLGWLPLPVLAGFILWIGTDLMWEWLVREFRFTPPGEAWLTVAIFLALCTFGLFEGILFGLVAGGVLFILDYSRLDPVRRSLSGDAYHSSTEMSETELKALQEHGASIAILKLQGYIFFGTAHRLRDQVRALADGQKLRVLLLDFEAVTGIDATAVTGLQRIAEEVGSVATKTMLTGMSDRVAMVVHRAGLPDSDSVEATAAGLNAGLAACETELLAEVLPSYGAAATGIDDMLATILPESALRDRILPYLQRLEIDADKVLIREGEEAADIFFLEQGEVTVFVGAEPQRRRVRKLQPGAIFGEISAYRRGIRTSTVQADTPVRVWRLSAEALARVLAEDPELASHFHAGMAAILAERVSANTRLIQILRA